MPDNDLSANACLTLRGTYLSDVPGGEGETELSIHFGSAGTEIWSHDSNLGQPECLVELPASSTWRDIVDALIADERVPSPLEASDITLQGDRPPLGVLLGCIFACRPEDKSYLNLLLELPPHTLDRITSRPSWNLDVVAGELAEIEEFFQEDAFEVPLEILDATDWATISDVLELRTTIARRCEEISKNREEEDNRRGKVLAPFAGSIESFLHAWRSTQPREGKFQYAHVKGLPRLSRYIENYVLENGCLPTGIHEIPAGADIGPYAGPAFKVAFPQWEQG